MPIAEPPPTPPSATPASAVPTAAVPTADVPTADEPRPPPEPPAELATTLDEVPDEFWDEAPAARPAPSAGPTWDEAPATPAAQRGDRASGPEARLASLTGLPLLAAVFPGRILKVVRPMAIRPPADGSTDGDASEKGPAALPTEAGLLDPDDLDAQDLDEPGEDDAPVPPRRIS